MSTKRHRALLRLVTRLEPFVRPPERWTPKLHGSVDEALELWHSGNFSCDCNRGIFFDVELPCGQGGVELLALEEAAGE